MGNYSIRVLTPLLFHVNKFWENIFLGHFPLPPVRNLKRFWGIFSSPKIQGARLYDIWSEHFPLSPIVSELILAKHSPQMSKNVKSSNLKCVGTSRADNSETMPIYGEGSQVML